MYNNIDICIMYIYIYIYIYMYNVYECMCNVYMCYIFVLSFIITYFNLYSFLLCREIVNCDQYFTKY